MLPWVLAHQSVTTSGHGTSSASVAAGKNFGNASKATSGTFLAISDNVGMDIEEAYDLIKIFHNINQQMAPLVKETQLLLMVLGVIKTLSRQHPILTINLTGHHQLLRN